MHLIVLGLNHKSAPVEVREQFSLSKEKICDGLRHICNGMYEGICEAVILSTCNRSELYAVVQNEKAQDNENLARALRLCWSDLTGSSEILAQEKYFYTFFDEDCIRHLFYVASSLDSLILGEGQILSQVKQAYSLAHETGATSTILNTLFHRAIKTGKRVRTDTQIAYRAVSVSYAAVELARQIFGTLEKTSALVFGAGQMAELTLENLVGQGIHKIYIANRHRDKAEEMAKKFHGKAVDFDEALCLKDKDEFFDLVITSTGAPHYVIRPWETQIAMKQRNHRPLLFIDIAVPRDVDPDVEKIQGVTVYNIDDLEEVVDTHKNERKQEAERAKIIIEEEIVSIMEKFKYLSCQPLMQRLSNRVERIRSRETSRLFGKLLNEASLDDKQKRLIENFSRKLVRKILRFPMMEMNASAGTSREEFYKEAMQQLFKLDTIEPNEPKTKTE